MTLKLILIRHAKSSWNDPLMDDHARTLNKRGRETAPLIGDWLNRNGHRPERVYCSDARRAVETLSLILPAWEGARDVSYHPDLYLAPPHIMLTTITQATANTIAVVGHNPGIGALANGVAAAPASHPRFTDYPTCAAAVIEFSQSTWSDVGMGSGTVRDFVVPADLAP